MADNRVKYAYLNYDEISNRIEDGDIDAYDIVFTKDTHEQYFVKEDLELLSIKSRVNCFDSVQSANTILNSSKETYEGQIVAIADNDLGVYHGYIVNKSDDTYVVTSLADSGIQIDYNSLKNTPIVNVGTLAEPIIVGNLDNGVYSVSGEYKLFEDYPTIFSSSTDHLFFVGTDEGIKYVKEISSKTITTYTFADGVLNSSDVLTIKYLEDNGYITNDGFDAKIEALDLVSKSYVAEYVEKITTEYLDKNLGTTIDDKIDEKLASMVVTDSDIEDLFK